MERGDVEAWVKRYVRAWTTNDPDDIAGLFTEEARYFPEPFAEPWTGRDTIVARWLGRRDAPGSWEFRHRVLAVDGALAFVGGETTYRDRPRVYSNLWVIRLENDGRCSEFTEWWMEHESREQE
ncbi:MAG: nuclear transport factor 2 family protein [Actinomycetota bacterium]|nr:nuclear transport factor 2 family protein [Actinomycetota bacterium]